MVIFDEENKPGTILFVNEAYKHCKAIYFGNETEEIVKASNVGKKNHEDPAIINSENKKSDEAFITAIANHRVWELETERNNPA